MCVNKEHEELEGTIDTIYGVDCDIWKNDNNTKMGTHKYNIFAKDFAIKDDDDAIYEMKRMLNNSLKQFFKAYQYPSGEYYFDITISRNDSYGEEEIDHEEGFAEWDSEYQQFKFII